MVQNKRFCLSALLLFILVGCGPGYGDLQGKVTLDDKPLTSGTVTTFGSDGLPKQGLIKEDGTYTVEKIAAGTIKLAVTSIDPEANVPKGREKGPQGKIERPKADRSKWFPIPADYGDTEKSGITFELKSGPKNTFDIKLKSK